MKIILFLLGSMISLSALAQKQYRDVPYIQHYAEKFILSDDLTGTDLLQVASDRNRKVEVLSDKGLLQPWDKKLTKDGYYRPLGDMKLLTTGKYEDQFVYLTPDELLSNAWAGTFYIKHGMSHPELFVVGHNFTTLIAGKDEIALFQDKKKAWSDTPGDFEPLKMIFDMQGKRFLVLAKNGLYELKCPDKKFTKVYDATGLTAMALYDGKIVVGTNDGVVYLNGKDYSVEKTDKKLPWTEITSLENIKGELWFGSTKGAFKLRKDGKYDYYASERWLTDDDVKNIAEGPDNSVLVLTRTGLSRIDFVPMALADKAEYFEKIQRKRHIRYGLTSDLALRKKGDVSTGYYHDTDNDGLWTSMYLASELFRYAVTKSDDAKQNAYEAFEAMERLATIANLNGFPARSFERDGYEVGQGSNGFSEEWRKEYEKKYGRIWRLADDSVWRWKSQTSSDESCGHFFAFALFAELAPDQEWRDRAVDLIRQEMDHIMEHDWYLVDWNGKPTAWGRWNPKYVNSFPINVGDRRLNSTLVLAFLQTAYHFTGDEKYKKAAMKLIKKYGYDENANRPASVIRHVEGEPLSDGWNHSDDEMYFLTAPAFVRYSFTKEQEEKHFAAVQSHWKMELSEKNPLWNFFYAMVGGKDYDLDGSIWWLQRFPMDLIGWNVTNKHRKDITRLPPNFRNQKYPEVLPPDECPLHLHNGAYIVDGGNDGMREYAPYIYLMPYWMGRYVGAISAPQAE